ncbi:hypothetical protein [Nocardia sp. NBC_01009]|uniref:WXG100 family type VII secretion target n=1 Tax=Nocardia sp. NBC_01009 TaxID=2975996 RepID=UPI00386A17C7|nr:hypothetical protein OHA42_05695 [Nocardia sp. NBC_01009]
MGESLEVDPDLLRALAPELNALADMAQNELTQLKATLNAEGECWGNDEPGRTFGESYEPAAEQGLAGYKNLIDNLRRIGDSATNAADTFHNQDQEVGNQIRNLELGGPQPGWNTPTPSFDQPLPGAGRSPAAPPPNSSAPNPKGGAGAPNPSGSQSPSPRSEQPQPASNGSPYSPYQPLYPDYGPDAGQGLPGEQPIGSQPGSIAPPASKDSAPPRAAASPSGKPERPPIAGRSDTPWSGSAPDTPWQRKGSAPGTPSKAGAPISPTGSGAQSPRNAPGGVPPRVSPPQPGSPGPGQAPAKRAKPSRNKKTRRPQPVSVKPKRVATDPAAMEVARQLATRHGLQIVGFETSGVAERTVQEIAAAVDDILGKYPFLKLGGIEISELGDAASDVKWKREAGWIILDGTVLADPAKLADIVSAATRSGASVPGSDERPMYSTIVNDLGRVMEAAAGPAARKRAHATLIAEYRRISGPWDRTDTLAQIVAGYRKWRAQLSGRCFSGPRFEPRAALIEAFTEVELCGDKACGPAKVLHQLVVETARGRSDIG